ncbi:hypothetical protein BRC61_02715 [Halobacteriales archaeon QH_10_65_19]|nr:MAG: hypothetical protein BRC61_02715 [Halobacteriales archaeon QH_10_65_19]
MNDSPVGEERTHVLPEERTLGRGVGVRDPVDVERLPLDSDAVARDVPGRRESAPVISRSCERDVAARTRLSQRRSSGFRADEDRSSVSLAIAVTKGCDHIGLSAGRTGGCSRKRFP